MKPSPGPGQRIAVGIEYDGSAYAGWQRQPDSPSVQAEVERALGFVADHDVAVHCGGRTDTGVHAIGQVAHFDTHAIRSLRSWVLGANTRLPTDIAVTWARTVPADFHARYSALSRTYRYFILNRETRPALGRARVAWIHEPLDAGRMHEAAQLLVGEHDFSAFRAAECQSSSPVRRLQAIQVERDGQYVVMEVTANAFLHHMVRNIAGSLIAVGTGERDRDWFASILAGRERKLAGITAPAGGLYFLRIHYPDVHGLPVPSGNAWDMMPFAPQRTHA